MEYSFLRLSTFYSSILKKHYQDLDLSKFDSYQSMHSYLIEKHYGISDAYERSLKKLFNVDAGVIITNDHILQNKWAQEHNLSSTGHSLVLEQIKFYKPSVVLIEDLFWADESFITSLRQLPFVKLICGHHCAPHNEQIIKRMKLLDFIISCSPLLVNEYKRQGIENTYLIYHAFDASLFSYLKKEKERTADLVFIGSFLFGADGHNTRAELILKLIEAKVDIKIFAESPVYGGRQKLKYAVHNYLQKLLNETQVNFLLKKIGWSDKFSGQSFWKILRPYLHPPVYGLDMYNEIYNARIGFNSHGDIVGSYAANMRMFEVTGVGACLVTEDKINMKDLFQPGVECVTYSNADDAKEKITWLLNNPEKLAAIAKAGQERCLKDHSYDSRATLLNDIILNYLKS